MDNLLVSIIIPTCNRAHLIGETLNSVLAQTYQNWECIVVDDGSTDNTVEVVNSYINKDTRFQYHHRPADRPAGGNAARNYGFELSKGEYVNWFDDDDIMMNCFLKNKIELFNNKINLVICSGVYTDQNLNKLQDLNINIDSFLFKDYVLWKSQILTPSVLFRKSFLENKELFNLNIFRGQETEFFSRLFYKLSTEKYLITNIPLFLYRQHIGSKTYKNNDYVRVFKESQTIIMIENFKKSIQLNDSDLIRYYYNNLMDFFYRGLEQKHLKNCIFIVKKATPQFFLINKKLAMNFGLSSCFFILLRRGSYKIEKYFKRFPL